MTPDLVLPPELVMVTMTMITVTPIRARQHPPTRRGWSFIDCLTFIFFIVLMMMVKCLNSQLIVYQTIVLPLHTLHLTCLS